MTSTPTACPKCGRLPDFCDHREIVATQLAEPVAVCADVDCSVEHPTGKPRQPDTIAQVFICNRGGVKTVKVQLELSQATLDAYKERAKSFQGGQYSPKQIMENMLRNWIDGVCADE